MQCFQLNGTYTVVQGTSGGQSCIYNYNLSNAICGFNVMLLQIGPGMTVTLNNLSGQKIVWKLASLTDNDCLQPYTLSLDSSTTYTGCALTNSKAVVVAVVPPPSDPDFKACVSAMLKDCPKGTLEQCLNAPFQGGPAHCCVPSPCSCEDSKECKGCKKRVDALRYTYLAGKCRCRSQSSCPPESDPVFSRNAVSQVTTMLARWQQQLRAPVPGALDGPGRLNVASGNLVVRLSHPDGGAFDPVPFLTYNSDTPASSEFGYGWFAAPKQVLTSLSSTSADVTDGGGTVLHFTSKDSNGRYLAPSSTADALVLNSDGTWTQTQPDGFQMRYDSTGRLTRLSSASGSRWTLSYGTGGRISRILDPFNRPTTYAYDGNNNLRRVQDASARISSFTVNAASGNLTRMVRPDGTIISLTYDTSHRLTAYIDSRGQRTSYGYDANSWVNRITTPTGARTTYLFRDWLTTRVTDPKGQTTTLLHNMARNITGVINPKGNRSTYLWSGNRLKGFVDGDGHRTTLTYALLVRRNYSLQSIQDAMGGRFTFAYDANDRLVTLIDQLGNRATLLWDSSGNRTAVIDPVGNRTSSLYNGQGQITASIDALAHRTTMVYDATGQVVARINALGKRTSYAYSVNRQLLRTQSPLGQLTTYLRDPLNRATALIDPLGRRSTYVYDAAGNRTATINPLGLRRSLTYDACRLCLPSCGRPIGCLSRAPVLDRVRRHGLPRLWKQVP
jgi:YD repeat-containing protein